MKGNKGITLIALIITIVVLLILAVVAIKAVQGDGIITYAQNATTSYNQAQKDESDILQIYMNQISDATKPVKLIKFYIDTSDIYDDGEVLEFTAEEGMTWNDWTKSKYFNLKPGHYLDIYGNEAYYSIEGYDDQIILDTASNQIGNRLY